MTLAVTVASAGVRIALGHRAVSEAARAVLRAERVRRAMLSVTFVSRSHIAGLNRRHLGRRGATDVIAFTLATLPRGAVVGDIYIAPEVARENARRARVAVREELLRLVIHGVLHVAGHDHPGGGGRERSPMWARQERLVKRLAASRQVMR